MKNNNWIRSWINEKIKYYESFIKNNPDSALKNEFSEGIKILKDLL